MKFCIHIPPYQGRQPLSALIQGYPLQSCLEGSPCIKGLSGKKANECIITSKAPQLSSPLGRNTPVPCKIFNFVQPRTSFRAGLHGDVLSPPPPQAALPPVIDNKLGVIPLALQHSLQQTLVLHIGNRRNFFWCTSLKLIRLFLNTSSLGYNGDHR